MQTCHCGLVHQHLECIASILQKPNWPWQVVAILSGRGHSIRFIMSTFLKTLDLYAPAFIQPTSAGICTERDK